MKYIYTLILLLTMMMSSCSGLQTDNNWIDGNWSGMGFQPGFNNHDSWDIEVSLNIKQELFKISYPSLDCSGDWMIINIDKHKATFKELNIDNTVLCTDNGTVIITKVDEHHISYSYYTENDKRVSSYATLSRN